MIKFIKEVRQLMIDLSLTCMRTVDIKKDIRELIQLQTHVISLMQIMKNKKHNDELNLKWKYIIKEDITGTRPMYKFYATIADFDNKEEAEIYLHQLNKNKTSLAVYVIHAELIRE